VPVHEGDRRQGEPRRDFDELSQEEARWLSTTPACGSAEAA
jgi:hypothetical protein